MDADPQRTAAIAADLAARGYGIRVISTSLALAWVADGRRAAYVTAVDVRNSVHFQAGLAVCQAAGCVTSDLRGEGFTPGAAGLVVAADVATHRALQDSIAAVTRS
jgi:myo-inositol-1(or 4)-monophosphatase